MKAHIYSFVFLALLAVAYATNECPEEEGEEAYQFANPEDCSTFYKCSDEGVPVLHTCPDGLEYNAALGVCDWPATAGCSVTDEK